MDTLPASVLTKKQTKQFGPVHVKGYGDDAFLTATVRYDDQCWNGHNTFSIMGDIVAPVGNYRKLETIACGCLHEEIAAAIPELAPLIKWHLCSSDGPMHYIANTIYHADEHGPTHAWVYFTGLSDPKGLMTKKEQLLGYFSAAVAKPSEGEPGYRMVWDEKTAKVRNLKYARSSAIWPDATDEDLTAPGLKERLEARLPALMAEFKMAVESLGFTY